MSAQILDGRSMASTIRTELRQQITAITTVRGYAPTLAVVQVLGDAASDRYVKNIRKMGTEAGALVHLHTLPPTTDQATLEATITQLSNDRLVDGIILQLPLPAPLVAEAAIAQIDPRKDVDGVTAQSAGFLVLGQPGLRPNTPAGGMELLKRYDIPLKGRHAVVVGRSAIVGKPMALMLLEAHATVTIAHSRTADLVATLRGAEIIAAAVGQPGLIRAEMLRPDAVVIDFGINVLADGKVVGDVEAAASEVVAAITPVPGGTGPMTNAMLLRNLVQAASRR
ncbi:MAG: bifunctional 5,10-methylenetetrahydrofolate dehydrogenase/5,10-methenyltetrahydrofolate cyclohydrolase [Roseiflexaceae bacterium]